MVVRALGRVRTAALLAVLTGAACGETPSEVRQPAAPQPIVGSRTLAIAPAIQQTEVWCWAATAEMVLRYYRMPNVNGFGNFQCGIVAAWFGTQGYPQCLRDCGQCRFPVGVMSNQHSVITGYGRLVRSLGGASPVLSANLVFRPLTAAEIKQEIDGGRPIVVGVAPGGGFALPNASQHIAVIVGYDFSAAGEFVIVNDPFPFDFFPYNQNPHPYLSQGGTRLQIGRFRIPLSLAYGPLGWANSIYRIQ